MACIIKVSGSVDVSVGSVEPKILYDKITHPKVFKKKLFGMFYIEKCVLQAEKISVDMMIKMVLNVCKNVTSKCI